jgi:hypothetical protein
VQIWAAEIVSEALEASGRQPQSLEPLGDLGFCQVHRLQELDVIGPARLEVRVLEAERKQDRPEAGGRLRRQEVIPSRLQLALA